MKTPFLHTTRIKMFIPAFGDTEAVANVPEKRGQLLLYQINRDMSSV